MKIAIVHEFLTKIGGAEKVLLALHQAYPDAPIFTLLYDEAGTNGRFKDCEIIPSRLQKYPSFLRKKTKYFLGKLPEAIEEFNFSEYDVVISSSNSFAHGIITKPKTFHISYCHSPMRYVWDWHSEYLQEHNIGFGITGLYIRDLLHKIRIWDKVSSDRVDSWIANSKNVKERIKKYYLSDSELIYPPVEIDKIALAKDVPDDYYVILSRLEPYKKIDLAIEAFNQLGKQLVIIGTGSAEETLKSKANKNIEFLGWQSDQSVYEYIRNSKAFIFPGEDDFGITMVEALSCGRPVIAFNKGGSAEIIDSKTGLFFDQPNAESLKNAVEKLEHDYLRYTPTNCRERAEQFSQEKFIAKFTNHLESEHEKFLRQNEKS